MYYKIFKFTTNLINYVEENYLFKIKEIFKYEKGNYEKVSYVNILLNYYLNFFYKFLCKKEKNNYIVKYKVNNNYKYKVFKEEYFDFVINYDYKDNEKFIMKKPIKNINITYNNDIIVNANNIIQYLYKFTNNSEFEEILTLLDYNSDTIKHIDIQFMRNNKRILNLDKIYCEDIFK